jgi:hypothetical protein
MPADKYVVLRTEDLQKYLSPEWQAAVPQLLSVIEVGRYRDNKSTNPVYFVLKMSDPFAQEAVKAYIRAAASDPRVADNQAVQSAIAAARDVLTVGSMSSAPKLPD